jgi:hypothetical protein
MASASLFARVMPWRRKFPIPPSGASCWLHTRATSTTKRCCRSSKTVAESDSPTSGFAEFSSKWRTRSSHLRGGSEHHTVVPLSRN